MTGPNHVTTLVGTVVGTSATTFPLWSETVAVLSGANQFVIAICGLVVVALTIRKLTLEIRIAKQRLDGERPPK